MGNEILVTIILGILIGLVVGYFLFAKLKFLNKVEQIKQRNIIKDPHKLKELLDKNGTFIDQGKEISFEVVQDEKGKDILKQNITEIKKFKPKDEEKTAKK